MYGKIVNEATDSQDQKKIPVHNTFKRNAHSFNHKRVLLINASIHSFSWPRWYSNKDTQATNSHKLTEVIVNHSLNRISRASLFRAHLCLSKQNVHPFILYYTCKNTKVDATSFVPYNWYTSEKLTQTTWSFSLSINWAGFLCQPFFELNYHRQDKNLLLLLFVSLAERQKWELEWPRCYPNKDTLVKVLHKTMWKCSQSIVIAITFCQFFWSANVNVILKNTSIYRIFYKERRKSWSDPAGTPIRKHKWKINKIYLKLWSVNNWIFFWASSFVWKNASRGIRIKSLCDKGVEQRSCVKTICCLRKSFQRIKFPC